jgi:hypothetical protein
LCLAAAVTATAGPVAAATNTLSLSAVGAFRTGGASIAFTGYNGNLLLPAEGGTPGIAFGFTVPNDYDSGPLRVVILWDSSDTACDVLLAPSFVYRARNGRARDGGGQRTGFDPLGASTPYTITAGGSIVMGAPDPVATVERVTFTIVPTAAQFVGPFKPGDAINFGIERRDNDARDTCTSAMGISGVSIEYRTP